MDLDMIKKDWQEASLKSTINEEKITQMIDNKGQSAFNKLLKYERFGMIILPFLIITSPFFRFIPLIIFFVLTCLLGAFWQGYKYKFLKKIDFLRMNIIEISRFFITYRKYVIIEAVVSIVWFFTIISMLAYMTYENLTKEKGKDGSDFITFISIITAIGFVVMIVVSWFIYWKHVRTLGRSIKELEELEKENNE